MQTFTVNGEKIETPFASLLPPLTDEELRGLKADILQNGILQPVICTKSDGRVILIDGHNRASLAAALGMNVPVFFKDYSTEEAMRRHALDLNLHRRHLTREKKQEFITILLKNDPERSDRSIAAQVGVSDKTVGAIRAEKVATAEIPQLGTTTGKDGVIRKKPTTLKKPTPTPGSMPFKSPSELPRTPIDSATASDTAPRKPIKWAQLLELLVVEFNEFASGARKLSKRRKSDRDPSEVRTLFKRARAVLDKYEREPEFFATCEGGGGRINSGGQPEEVVM